MSRIGLQRTEGHLQEGGRGHADRRLVLRNPAQALVRLPHIDEVDGGSVEQRHHDARRETRRVRDRGRHEHHVGLGQVEHVLGQPVGGERHGAEGVLAALGARLRSGGVDDRMRDVGAGHRAELGLRGHGVTGTESLEAVLRAVLRGTHRDDALEAGRAVFDAADHREVVEVAELGRDDRDLRTGVVDDELDLVVAVDRHRGDQDGAQPGERDVDHDELVPVGQLHLHAVAGDHAELLEREREAVGLRAQFAAGQGAVVVGEGQLACVLVGPVVDVVGEAVAVPVALLTEGRDLRVRVALGGGECVHRRR